MCHRVATELQLLTKPKVGGRSRARMAGAGQEKPEMVTGRPDELLGNIMRHFIDALVLRQILPISLASRHRPAVSSITATEYAPNLCICRQDGSESAFKAQFLPEGAKIRHFWGPR